MVRLVEHDQPRAGFDDRTHSSRVEQIAGRIVGIRDERECRLMRLDLAQHATLIQAESGCERHPDIAHTGERRRHLEYHERRFHAHQRRAGAVDRLRQNLNQLVGAISQQQLHIVRDAHRLTQSRLQRCSGRIRIAVQGGGGGELADLRTEIFRQQIRILHRVQLHERAAVGNVVGRQRLDLCADDTLRGLVHVGHLIHGTGSAPIGHVQAGLRPSPARPQWGLASGRLHARPG